MADWVAWHEIYADPDSQMSRRLALVQRLIERRLDRTWPKRLRVLSICAGEGRDILRVLADRDDADRVTATLLELDPVLCARARDSVAETRLEGIEIREVDASLTDAYDGAVPADLLLLIGFMGYLDETDTRTLLDALPAMCNPNALVIWSRRRDGDLIGRIRDWFEDRGFVEVFSSRHTKFYLGAYRFTGEAGTLPAGRKLFSFVD